MHVVRGWGEGLEIDERAAEESEMMRIGSRRRWECECECE